MVTGRYLNSLAHSVAQFIIVSTDIKCLDMTLIEELIGRSLGQSEDN